MSETRSGVSRRTIVKGAAWSVPVVAAAAAVPLAAASTTVPGSEPNSLANYYWASEAQETWSSLDPAGGNRECRYSTRVAFRQEPWTSGPPAGGTLQITVAFSQDVTLKQAVGQNWVQISPAGLGPANAFVFQVTPSGFGADLSINFNGSASGEISATSTMLLINGGDATWASESSDATAVLVD